MDREIKFRVWNNTCKYFVRRAAGGFSAASFNVLSFSDYLKNNNICNIDLFTIQQCTGQKDVNGKEIYEGDIVEIDNEKWKIFWYDYQWGIENNKDWRLEDDSSRQSMNWAVYPRCKVIGNIFENMELLK